MLITLESSLVYRTYVRGLVVLTLYFKTQQTCKNMCQRVDLLIKTPKNTAIKN